MNLKFESFFSLIKITAFLPWSNAPELFPGRNCQSKFFGFYINWIIKFLHWIFPDFQSADFEKNGRYCQYRRSKLSQNPDYFCACNSCMLLNL